MPYLLDADVFIRAKNDHYPFDYCPAFWDWLIRANTAGEVFSIEHVENDLAKVGDVLSAWAGAQGATFFLRPDSAVVGEAGAVSAWAVANFEPGPAADFLSKSDYWLVVFGRATGYTVVTHETYQPEARKRIKIPVACKRLGVAWTTPWEMIRSQGPHFILA